LIRVPPVAVAIAGALLLALAACAATPAIEPGKPLEVQAHPLPPYQVHEECASLHPGDRLFYRFESKAPLAFNIHYREGKAVVMPVTRERATADEGTFVPRAAHDYCLMWEAGAEGTTIDYSMRLTRGGGK
jgi:phosphodiesterase/alkaline phosphatase D-like protein